MGWFRKEDESKIPDKLKAMTAEQIISAMESGEKSADEMKKLQAALAEKDGAINETKTELTRLQEQFRTLEANRATPPKKDEGNNEIQFVDDPEGYVQQQIAKNTIPTAVATMRATAQLARETARRQLLGMKVPGTNINKAALMDRWSTEMDKAVETVQLQFLQDPKQWVYVFNNILGQHMDEILQSKADGKEPDYFAEPGHSEAGRRQEPKKEDQLTEEEINIAKRMKIKPEEYLKNRQAFGG